MPAEPQPAADGTAVVASSDETAKKLQDLQAKTKAGFGKVKEDLKKHTEALE